MKKRIMLFALMLSMVLSICGCGNNEEDREQHSEQNREEKSLFDELKGNRFVFSSGAGAWGTELIISEDGSFKGYQLYQIHCYP